jgi:hypothetical protein
MAVLLATDSEPVTVTRTDTFYPYGVEVLFERLTNTCLGQSR